MIRAHRARVGFAVVFGILFFANVIFAAQSAKIDVDQAMLYEGPGTKFKKKFEIPRGVTVEASNLPVEGFYKVRLPNGKIGWLAADTINFGPKAENQPKIQYQTAPEAVSVGPGTGLKKAKPAVESKSVNFGFFGDFDLFKAAEINTLFSTDKMSNGIGFGGELTFYPNSSIGVVVRFEKVLKSLNVTVDGSNEPYSFSLSSIPFMAGIEIPVAKEGNSGLAFDIMLGIAASTQFSGTATNYASDNVTTYSGTGMSALFKFDYNLALSSGFGFFGELGYRYLRTGTLSPGLAVYGSNLFKDVGGNPIPLKLDMSGIVVGGGMRLTF